MISRMLSIIQSKLVILQDFLYTTLSRVFTAFILFPMIVVLTIFASAGLILAEVLTILISQKKVNYWISVGEFELLQTLCRSNDVYIIEDSGNQIPVLVDAQNFVIKDERYSKLYNVTLNLKYSQPVGL